MGLSICNWKKEKKKKKKQKQKTHKDQILMFLGCFLDGGVNPDIVKNIARYNFQIATVMYIKVYIFGVEMSQRIYFWYQILLKMLFFEKMAKNPFF